MAGAKYLEGEHGAECGGAGTTQEGPPAASTPTKEVELGCGSGCLRWARRHHGKMWAENKRFRPLSYL